MASIRYLILTGALATILCGAPPSRIERSSSGGRLYVDGKPFIVLGAQLHNSSAWPDRLENIWPQIEALGANTLEAPVYWEALEPEAGRFDYRNVDALILGARRHGLRLILLWFGTWKNGAMDYAPAWLKEDGVRFPRVLSASGVGLHSLSPHSRETRDADARAFAALMTHVRQTDEAHGTVIMVQVENEPGTLGSDRDHGATAERLFAGDVPSALTSTLGNRHGTWTQLFGDAAAETFNAWHVASFINAVAQAGKEAYSLPMYVNVWLRDGGFERPGETYPSGGATANVIPVWKAAAPAIDLLAPDIYLQGTEANRAACRQYLRPDNPLLIPESGGSVVFARYLFRALGSFGAIGFATFGFDREGTKLDPRLQAMADSFHLLRPALPLILAAQGEGRVRAVIEDELVAQELVHLSGFDALVSFREHGALDVVAAPNALERQGRLLILEERPGVIWLLGFAARIQFRSNVGSRGNAEFLSVEEGQFRGADWSLARLRNGDEIFGGLVLNEFGSVLRVNLKPIDLSQ